jgi:hypothetical protein
LVLWLVLRVAERRHAPRDNRDLQAQNQAGRHLEQRRGAASLLTSD